MRYVFILLLISTTLLAQEAAKSTSAFTVSGQVKAPKTFTFDQLAKFPIHNLGDVVITNHKGDPKGTAKELSGVLLTEILRSMELVAESPKVLSEFYFTCIASDGYKVVFSWNELFNTTVGNSVYIVTSKDHQSMQKQDTNVLMISTQDVHTGRRYLKNLETVLVGRVK